MMLSIGSSSPAPPMSGSNQLQAIQATGLEHILLSFADPFTVHAWSGQQVDGVPKLAG
jgi:hypothetical protein